jgi:hypothetical protein
LFGVWDDDFNLDTSLTYITQNIYDIDPPNSTHAAQGINRCKSNYTNVEASLQLFWNLGDPAHHALAPRHRWKHNERHENDGGELLAAFDVSAQETLLSPPFFDYKIQLIQIDGLIQQSRQLRIAAWAFVKNDFPAAIRDNWDGVFTERAAYEQAELRWEAPANGPFGGSMCEYTQSHPTAANGCGWIVTIYEGATLVWTGLKEIDEVGEGIYLRTVASPNVPACILVEENPPE